MKFIFTALFIFATLAIPFSLMHWVLTQLNAGIWQFTALWSSIPVAIGVAYLEWRYT